MVLVGYTVADLPTLDTYLVEARRALHELSIGKRAVSASYEGKSATFTQANISDLRGYINDLMQTIAALSGVPFARRRPIHLTF